MVIQRRRNSSSKSFVTVGGAAIAPLESTNQISSSEEDSSESWDNLGGEVGKLVELKKKNRFYS